MDLEPICLPRCVSDLRHSRPTSEAGAQLRADIRAVGAGPAAVRTTAAPWAAIGRFVLIKLGASSEFATDRQGVCRYGICC